MWEIDWPKTAQWIIGVLGGGGIIGWINVLYHARSQKRKRVAEIQKLDIGNANALMDVGVKFGAMQAKVENAELGDTAKDLAYESPQPPPVSLDLVRSYLKSMGLSKSIQTDEETLLFGGTLDDLNITFILRPKPNAYLQLRSFSVEIADKDILEPMLMRLLALNADNRIGQIGLQGRDGKQRIWIDQNLPLENMHLSLDAFKLVIAMVALAHRDVLQTLKETAVTYVPITLADDLS